MAKVTFPFDAADVVLQNAAQANHKVIVGTNFPVHALEFPSGVQRSGFFKLRASSYISGAVGVEIDWFADTALAGDVTWQAALAAVTPEVDAVDILTKAFATQQTVTQSHLGTTAARAHRAVLSLDQLDGLAAEDVVWLALRRSATDTLVGKVRLLHLTASYTI